MAPRKNKCIRGHDLSILGRDRFSHCIRCEQIKQKDRRQREKFRVATGDSPRGIMPGDGCTIDFPDYKVRFRWDKDTLKTKGRLRAVADFMLSFYDYEEQDDSLDGTVVGTLTSHWVQRTAALVALFYLDTDERGKSRDDGVGWEYPTTEEELAEWVDEVYLTEKVRHADPDSEEAYSEFYDYCKTKAMPLEGATVE